MNDDRTMVFTGDALKRRIIEPIMNQLNAILKYETIPILFVQFLVDRINLQPTPVIYSVNQVITLSWVCDMHNPKFSDLIHGAKIKDYPFVTFMYNTDVVNIRDIILGDNHRYRYSTTLFMIDAAKLYDAMKNGELVLEECAIDTPPTNNSYVRFKWNKEDVSEYLFTMTKPFSQRLPFISHMKDEIYKLENCANLAKSSSNPDQIVISEKEQISAIMSDIKGSKCKHSMDLSLVNFATPESRNKLKTNIFVFGRMLKTAPYSVAVHASVDDEYVYVALETTYKTAKLSNLILYMYLNVEDLQHETNVDDNV